MSNSINLGKVAGSAWYTGAATTSSAIHTAVPTARIGDLYLSSGDNTYWQKQSETAWEKKGSLFPKTVVMTEEAFSAALIGNTLENDTLYLVEGETTGQINFIASAGNITYDNSTSGLNANNVQAAIDEVKSKLFSGSYNDLKDKPTSGDVTYNNATSGLTSNNVQGAIDEIKGMLFSGVYDDLSNKPSAGNIPFDNTLSGLNASDVQTAINRLKEMIFSGSYNDLTDKPSELTKDALLTLLLLTNEQLTKLIAFADKITVDSTGVTVGGVLKATTFDTTN